MGKILIITEKPSVAQEYASVLGVTGRKKGRIENGDYIITWCLGHLAALSYPERYGEAYKKWDMDMLPFLPDTYQYEIIPETAAQFAVVKEQLNREDVSEILYAGDPAREGVYIQYLVRQMAGHAPKAIEKCVWIDSQTEEEIKRGIREAKPLSYYDQLADSGYMRAIEDYTVGINFSRALTLQYGSLINHMAGKEGKQRTPLSVGRVMICVLGMAVRREREICGFVEDTFYRATAVFEKGGIPFTAEWKPWEGSRFFQSPLLFSDNGFRDKETAESFIASIKSIHQALVEKVQVQEERRKPPLLFNLAELQAECAKRFRISPDKTLETIQHLYEKKLLTYPRTDAKVLSSAVAKEIRKNLEGLEHYAPLKEYAGTILYNHLYEGLEHTRYVDDSKITDHYAIIPTGRTEGMEALTKQQREIYELAAKRFLSVFYPPAVYQNLSISIHVKSERFVAAEKVLAQEGWQAILKDGKKEGPEKKPLLAKLAEALHQGDSVNLCSAGLKEGKTTPPKRYTSGSMILAMEHAGQLVEDDTMREMLRENGIGTSATRADILKKLQKIGYIKVNEKTQAITPEPFGQMVYEVVRLTVPDLLEPDLTAAWERELDQVAKGGRTRQEFLSQIKGFVTKGVQKIKETNIQAQIQKAASPFARADLQNPTKMVGDCPECGKPLVERKGKYGTFVSCSGYPSCRYRPQKEHPDLPAKGDCPECGRPLVERKGKYGAFVSCSGYPACRYRPGK